MNGPQSAMESGPRSMLARCIALAAVAFDVAWPFIQSPQQVAGFMLAWAFLKSRTILVPIAMHAGGNFFAFASQVVGWYCSWYRQT